jgi:hypothetical protein
MLNNAGLKDLLSKKAMTPAVKQQAVAHLRTVLGMSERRAYAVVEADRTRMRYRSCRGMKATGGRVPSARSRPLRLRTVTRSSRYNRYTFFKFMPLLSRLSRIASRR